MDRIQWGCSSIERATARVVARDRDSWLRTILATVFPTAAAFYAAFTLWTGGARWSLFYAGVFLSSWLGGFRSGVGTTLLSAGLAWWFFIWPRHTWIKADPGQYIAAALFIAVGIFISVLHRRLRGTARQLAAALVASAGAMRELAESQRFLKAILDHSPNGIVVKSLDGRYILVNKWLASLVGLTPDAVPGRTDFELFPKHVAERFRSNDNTVRDSGVPLVTEERPGPSEDTVYLVSKFPLLDENGSVFAIGAIWTDIQERIRAEATLRQIASDLRIAQQVAHVGSWHLDLRSGLAHWSEELYRIFGRDPDEGVPRLLSEESKVLLPESTARLRAAVDKLRADGEPYELDLDFVRPDGSVGTVSGRGEAVRDGEGTIIAINGTAADITHLKSLERLREEWTSVVAHDLRQPIGVISAAPDLLPVLHAGEMSEQEREFMQRIRSAARALARMVDDLLDMSLLEAKRLTLERKRLEPEALVKEISVHLSTVTAHDRVRVHAGGGLLPVFVDPMRLEQVLSNLVSNAAKYGDDDSPIEVRIEGCDGEDEIAVTNRGAGIDREELPRLFNRFMRTARARSARVPGLGLGLYIAKGVIEAHGGRIWAESTPGQTTTFHIRLPAAGSTGHARGAAPAGRQLLA